MVTFTGTQNHLTDALIDLLKFEYDAMEAYNAAIERLDNPSFKTKLEEFKRDHLRHVDELREVITVHNITPPDGPDAKQWLTKGKVVIASLGSDNLILKAMKSNEEDIATAYERMVNRDDLNQEIKKILERAYSDEKRHKKWIEDNLE